MHTNREYGSGRISDDEDLYNYDASGSFPESEMGSGDIDEKFQSIFETSVLHQQNIVNKNETVINKLKITENGDSTGFNPIETIKIPPITPTPGISFRFSDKFASFNSTAMVEAKTSLTTIQIPIEPTVPVVSIVPKTSIKVPRIKSSSSKNNVFKQFLAMLLFSALL